MNSKNPLLPFSREGRVLFWGHPIDPLPWAKALDEVDQCFEKKRPAHIVTANPLMMMEAEKNTDLRAVFGSAEFVFPDSAGMVWALRRSGVAADKIPGVELIERLCDGVARRGGSVYLLGAAPGVAARAAQKLVEGHPGLRVVGTESGFFSELEESSVVDRIAQSRPDLLLVALGSPRQELWIHQHRSNFAPCVMVGVGGSFDVWSGDLKRAPAWLSRWGGEWLFRTLQEPSRFSRLAPLPRFVWRVLTAPPRLSGDLIK